MRFLKNTLFWIRKNKLEFGILFLILLVGAFLRLYKIDEYMTFLGDEGRDAIVVRRLLVNLDPILVGPGTSVGNMYLGPAYYYLIAPSLFLFNFSPVGPSVLVALIGVATIFLIYYISRYWFGKWGAIAASFLYAISPTVIILSRSSWNPNVMPFFSLLTIWSIWKIWSEKRFSWYLWGAVFYSFVLQSHYLGLIFIPFILFFSFITFIDGLADPVETRRFLKYFFLSLGIVFVSMLPLVVFDAKYDWRNFVAMKEFFLTGGGVGFSLKNVVSNFFEVLAKINVRLLGGQRENLSIIVNTVFVLVFGWIFFIDRSEYDRKKMSSYLLVFSAIIVGALGLSFYKHNIYDHYFGFLFPLPFIILALLLSKVLQHKNIYLKSVVIILVGVLMIINISNNPLFSSPARQMQRTMKVSEKMIKEARGERFNIAVIAEQNYEGAYQYFLEAWSAPFVIIDPQRYEETVTDTLFVVCEYEEREKCQPTSNPKAEVANFGWSKIDESWEVGGVILYKLIHNIY